MTIIPAVQKSRRIVAGALAGGVATTATIVGAMVWANGAGVTTAATTVTADSSTSGTSSATSSGVGRAVPPVTTRHSSSTATRGS